LLNRELTAVVGGDGTGAATGAGIGATGARLSPANNGFGCEGFARLRPPKRSDFPADPEDTFS